jgi:hypothetical protein
MMEKVEQASACSVFGSPIERGGQFDEQEIEFMIMRMKTKQAEACSTESIGD